MAAFHTSGAGKGSAYRRVDQKAFTAHHDFIFGVTRSYQRDPSGDDCQLRGKDEGKCWGSVKNYDYLEEGGDMVKVCRGHAEYFDWCANSPGTRKYIQEHNPNEHQ